MAQLPQLKRGDTFSLGCVSYSADKIPEDLTDFSIRSQIRSAGSSKFIAELTVAKSDQELYPGEFSVTWEETDNWPTGKLLLDIQFTNGSVVTSSETMELFVALDITHD